jgi:hypothetical protein
MTKKIIQKKQPAPAGRFIWLWSAAVALFLVVGGIVVWNQPDRQTTTPPQVTGAPRLAVDQTTIDEGNVPLGKSIRSAFHLQNVGDRSLQILGEPQVEVVEGC